MKITIPAQTVPIALGGTPTDPVWYEKLKFLELLQPLTDGDSALAAALALKSDVTRTINFQTGTSYTFQLTDAGDVVDFTNAAAVTATVPPNATVAFAVGTQIDVMQGGAGKVTLAQGAGVTINSFNGNKALGGQYVGGTLLKVATNTWRLMGNLIA